MKQIRKRLTYANVMSSIAVFLVLGGGAAIAAKIVLPKNSVGPKQLKKNAVQNTKLAANAVTGDKIADGSVATADLADAAATLAKLASNSVDGTKLVDGSVSTADLADAAVTLAKLADNAVNSAKVVNSSLTASDLGVNSVGFSEIAGNAVRGFQANASGPSTENFGSIATNACATVAVTASPIDGSILNDAIVATPPVAFAGDFSLQAEASTTTTFLLKACNNGTVNPQDPDGAGGSYQYLSFDG